ncbi:RNA recognition motif domain protein [Kalmanozyma brasiliensis GHG001]|uniref:RRM domain-containing protein n=1 Tax=Kalmanozyma brasiliensis (strain GHG001) TaxID=1365824 RepID=V5EUA8_KALBG|nr:RNA recognition motif domain protein [Kalmanozyma brasiliensis GHG001]EST08960.1 RNA recognition motif domain protein [Kalmanozyma brasiliensis GHG001]
MDDDKFDLYSDDLYSDVLGKAENEVAVKTEAEPEAETSGNSSKRQRADSHDEKPNLPPVPSTSHLDDALSTLPPAPIRTLASRPRPTDPSVQNALYIGDLNWWASDSELLTIASSLGIQLSLQDITFSEHKVNGKSKGVAYVETDSEADARKIKGWFDENDFQFRRANVTLTTSANGNPFRTLPKDPLPKAERSARGGPGGGMGMGGRGGMGGGRGGGMGAAPMAGAPIRMGGNAAPMGMMNPMMMGMMGANGPGTGANGGGRPYGRGGGRGGGWGNRGGRGGGQQQGGHFNPNFFGAGGMMGMPMGPMGGMGMGGMAMGGGQQGGPPGMGADDRERKRHRMDEN